MTRIVPCHETLLQLKAITSWSIKTVLSVAEIESKRIAPKFGWVTGLVALAISLSLVYCGFSFDRQNTVIYNPFQSEVTGFELLTAGWKSAAFSLAIWVTWLVRSCRFEQATSSAIKAIAGIVGRWGICCVIVVLLAALVTCGLQGRRLFDAGFIRNDYMRSELVRYQLLILGLVIASDVLFHVADVRPWFTSDSSQKQGQFSIGNLLGAATVFAFAITLASSYPHELGWYFYAVLAVSSVAHVCCIMMVALACQSNRRRVWFGWMISAVLGCVASSVMMIVFEFFADQMTGEDQPVSALAVLPALHEIWRYIFVPYLVIFLSGVATFSLLCVAGRIDRMLHMRWLADVSD